jgi:hypothetical protein
MMSAQTKPTKSEYTELERAKIQFSPTNPRKFFDATKLNELAASVKAQGILEPVLVRSVNNHFELVAGGGVVPPSVKGYFLIDTGASFTGIDAEVARELNLMPVSRTEAFGIGGSGMFEMVSANMLLYVGDVRGDRAAIGLFKDFICAPRLREKHDSYNLTAPDGSPLRIIGMLGRDFLQFATLTYNGLSGHWEMKIDPSVMRPQDGV